MSLRHHAFLVRRAAQCAPYLRRIPVATLEELFPGIGDLEISLQHRWQPRSLPYGEAYVLSLIAAFTHPRRIFEIGTGTGEGTLLIARQAPQARIDTLDLGDTSASLGEQDGDAPISELDTVGGAYRGSALGQNVVQHLGDSAAFDYAPFAKRMGLVFVDGAHTQSYVESDSRAARSMIAAGGVIVWDDCHLYHPGVSAALLALRDDGMDARRVKGTRLAVWRDPCMAE